MTGRRVALVGIRAKKTALCPLLPLPPRQTDQIGRLVDLRLGRAQASRGGATRGGRPGARGWGGEGLAHPGTARLVVVPPRRGQGGGGLEWPARRGRCPRPGRSRRPSSGACRTRTSCAWGSTPARRRRGPSKACTVSPPPCVSSTRAACSPSGTRPSCRSTSPSSTTRYGRTRRRSR